MHFNRLGESVLRSIKAVRAVYPSVKKQEKQRLQSRSIKGKKKYKGGKSGLADNTLIYNMTTARPSLLNSGSLKDTLFHIPK